MIAFGKWWEKIARDRPYGCVTTKLKPLLVSLYPPQQISQLGVDNISNLIELGFDVVLSAPAPETWRLLVRSCVLQLGCSTEIALYSSVPKIALKYKNP